MSSAAKKADRYIERGGYKRGERRERAPSDIIDVATFIAWHEDNRAVWGGITPTEAFAAFCRLIDFDPIELRKIIGR